MYRSALCLFLLLLTACGGGPATPFDELRRKVVTDHPLLVVPGRAFETTPGGGAWWMGNSASLLVHVLEPPVSGAHLEFLPQTPDAPCLRGLWDGEATDWSDPVDLEDRLLVEIPQEALATGTHFLTLLPCGEDDDGSRPAIFSEMRYWQGDSGHPVLARDMLRYRFLGDLLTFGVTGSGDLEKMDGTLFEGPRQLDVVLAHDQGGRLTMRVQNASESPARFSIVARKQVADLELEAGGEGDLEMTVPPGIRRLTLRTEGDSQGLFLWGAPLFRGGHTDPLPPIVLITLDTTRRDALGAYGGQGTPNLDRFAAQATVFERAYATSPWTLPSHASLFTGLYPSRHGAGVVSDHLESHFETLAEHLRDRGYLTAGFGGGLLTSFRLGVAQGFAFFQGPTGFEIPGDKLTDRALERIRTTGDSPFFLFVNYFDPHFPYEAPQGEEQRMALRLGLSPLGQALLDGSDQAWRSVTEGRAVPSLQERAALEVAYGAEVSFMDQQVGRLFDGLRQAGLYDKAWIFVTADHGELLGEGGHWSHNARLDPELMAIPLLIKAPGQTNGRRSDSLVSLVDLLPTILTLAAGIEPPEDLDGSALAADGSLAGRRLVYGEEHATEFHRLPPNMKISDHLYLRQGEDFRWISWEGGNLCQRLENEVPGTSNPALHRWREEICKVTSPTVPEDLQRTDGANARQLRIGLSAEEESRLKALGYL